MLSLLFFALTTACAMDTSMREERELRTGAAGSGLRYRSSEIEAYIFYEFTFYESVHLYYPT